MNNFKPVNQTKERYVNASELLRNWMIEDLSEYSSPQKIRRRMNNSDTFDKKSYEADRGDFWIDERRLAFFERPKDKALWDKCKTESNRIYGPENKKFTLWLYKKLGGQF